MAFTGVEASSAGQRHIDNFLKSPSKRSPSPQKQLKRKRTNSSPPENAPDNEWTCPECRKVIKVPEIEDEFAVPAEALAKLRMMHEDEHMAQELAEQFARQEARQAETSNVRPPPKKRKEGGILKFFKPK